MVNIAVDKSGSIWLEKKTILLPVLSLVLSNRFRADTNLPVYISGDRVTLHGQTSRKRLSSRPRGRHPESRVHVRQPKSDRAMKIRTPIPEKKSRLEIIPLIDIMFFLLASFMMISLQMQIVRTVKANLPTATLATSSTKPDIVNLQVNRDGQVSVDKKAISFSDLNALLTNRFNLNTNLPVYITGAQNATHGSVIYVLDLVKRAGISHVAIAVKAAHDQT